MRTGFDARTIVSRHARDLVERLRFLRRKAAHDPEIPGVNRDQHDAVKDVQRTLPPDHHLIRDAREEAHDLYRLLLLEADQPHRPFVFPPVRRRGREVDHGPADSGEKHQCPGQAGE